MIKLLDGNATSYIWVKYPGLMVDKIKDFIPAKLITAVKRFTLNDGFYNAVDNYVPEGVQIEIFSQCLAIAMIASVDLPETETREFAWDIVFDSPIHLEDEFYIEIEIKSWRRGLAKALCRGYVNGRVVCHGTMDLVVLALFNQYRLPRKQ